jgi:hypothetical protein
MMKIQSMKYISAGPYDENSPVELTFDDGSKASSNLGSDVSGWIPEFLVNGGVVGPYIAPIITPLLSAPKLVANALIKVVVGELEGMATAAGLSFAFAIDVGIYWVFFTEEMPDLNYSCNVNTSEGHANVTDRQLSYFEVTIKDNSIAIDPAELSIQVFRTQ